MRLGEMTLVQGDASAVPVLSESRRETLRAQHGDALMLEYRVFGENTGTAKGHNCLAEGCASDYIMIMNPDVIVNPRIFNQMLAPFLEGVPGIPAHQVGVTEARQTPIEHSKWFDEKSGETSWISTACALFPTAILREVKGFDEESFFMYCDDLDFSWRIRLSGYKAIYLPDAPVFHAKRLSGSGAWVPTSAERFYSAEAALLLAWKWSRPDITADNLNSYLALPPQSPEYKAGKAFEERREQGRLPVPVDPEHKVGSFTAQGYGEYRFVFDIT